MKPGTAPPVSYELRLSRPSADGTSPAPAHHNATGYSGTLPDPQKEALKRRVADQLIAHNPQLQLFQFPYDKIAQFEKLSLEEARRKYRHLELNGPEGGNGIQMILWDDDASLTVPFWHEREKAGHAFRELWNYLEIVCRETGYAIYDPQMNRTFNLSAGCEEILANYHRTARQVREALPFNGAHPDGLVTPGTTGLDGGDGRFPVIRQVAASGNSGAVWVAVRETGAVCGYAKVSVFRGAPCRASSIPMAHLESWYVAPEFRGCGIGQRLLEAAERWAAARGLRELASEVDPENGQLIRAHAACGFVESSRAIQFTKPIQGPVNVGRGAHSIPQPLPAREAAPEPEAHPRMMSTSPAPGALAASL